MKPKTKKLLTVATIIVVVAIALYLAYRYWAISIIKSNARKNMPEYIEQKAEENGTDFETQLHDDAVWIFKQNGFEWYK
jgi:hypothetical protein